MFLILNCRKYLQLTEIYLQCHVPQITQSVNYIQKLVVSAKQKMVMAIEDSDKYTQGLD